MQNVLSFPSRGPDHVSQKPLSTRSLPMRRRFFVLTLLACCVPAAVFAGKKPPPPPTYVFTSFDVPGWSSTVGQGVNHTGAIVGYTDSGTGVSKGFIMSAGTITQLNVPGALDTVAIAINDAGGVVGWYIDKN